MINNFHGPHLFLSNFYPAPFKYAGRVWPTVEHAYQALKTDDFLEQEKIRALPKASMAKSAGRKIKMMRGWDHIKLNVMEALVRAKFTSHDDLKRQLIATGDVELVEGNDWGDTFWGVCSGQGMNHLGRILMRVREDLRKRD